MTLDTIFINNKKFPICTIKHGELDLIKHGADFFTGTTIIESSETKKISDLVEAEEINYYKIDENIFKIESSLQMKNGIKELKSWIIDEKNNSMVRYSGTHGQFNADDGIRHSQLRRL